ncbi:glycosyltransferase [Stutzerimonas stutzeri]|uniref:glycosyltransferase n=1 Tax=Stutzerimonas stutzeri TaxID=316 RepID=UPI0015E2DEAF|nr:glycosyltransferase family 4 protein [Stutzerimonas stutzeri]MBA1277435.1 glycosyltransferase [Stutzerimonas stutzeri]
MKVLFVHDHKFKCLGGKYYSCGGLPSSIWPRYTAVLGEITVVGRDGGVLADTDKGFTLSSADDVCFHLLPNISNLKSLLFGNKEVKKSVHALVRQHDSLIARLPSRLGTLFVKEAIRQGKPYAIEVVGCPWDALWNYGGLRGKLFAPYAALELKRLAKSSRFALYVTEHFLQSRYPAHKEAVTTFCSNVEIPSVDINVLASRLDKILSDSSGQSVVFGLIANYSSKYKGIDVAIRALKEANLSSWQLKVLGSGDASYYQSLAEELGVSDKVHFVGSLPSGDPVFEWINSIDIYLHPSFQEGLPRALAEAMSRGAPALASKIAGIPELLNESELIAAGDYKALAKKIVYIANDKIMQASLAEQNFHKAKGYYKNILDERRRSFWQQFQESAGG